LTLAEMAKEVLEKGNGFSIGRGKTFRETRPMVKHVMECSTIRTDKS